MKIIDENNLNKNKIKICKFPNMSTIKTMEVPFQQTSVKL